MEDFFRLSDTVIVTKLSYQVSRDTTISIRELPLRARDRVGFFWKAKERPKLAEVQNANDF